MIVAVFRKTCQMVVVCNNPVSCSVIRSLISVGITTVMLSLISVGITMVMLSLLIMHIRYDV